MRTLLLIATLALVAAALPVQAAGPALSITSGTASAGSYHMTVDVTGFELVPVQSAPVNEAGKGHIHYFINGAPAPGAYATPNKEFTFEGLKAGDIVTAELTNNDHSSLSPPVIQTRVVEGAFSIASGTPQAGDYEMMVSTPSGFHLDPVSVTPVNKAGHGHIHYFLNGAPCQTTCALGASYATEKTSFTFHGLKAGDKVSAELVNNDHSSLAPAVLLSKTVVSSASGATTPAMTNSSSSQGAPGAGLLLAAAALGLALLLRRK
jgi:MYXO-CTERM domain-containing protein